MGIGLEFKFSPEWTGLNKTACFTADGKNLPSVRIPESGKITIPSEAFNQNNIMLNVGVYGETKDGKIVIPTIYCFLGNVRQGAQKCGRPPQPPTPDWTAGIEQDVADALTAARAVERRANAGEFNGEDAYELAVRKGFKGTEAEWLTFVEANGREAQAAATAAQRSAEAADAGSKAAAISEKNTKGFADAAAGNATQAAASAASARSEADRAKQVIDGFTLPTASKTQLGGVKVGEGLSVTAEGMLNADDGKFELIEKFTLAESAVFQKNKEPDGTPYSFKAVRVFIEQPIAAEAHYYIDHIGYAPFAANVDFTNNDKMGILSAEIKYGQTFPFAAKGPATYDLKPIVPDFKSFRSPGPLNQVRSYRAVPAGTKIEIWAVRA